MQRTRSEARVHLAPTVSSRDSFVGEGFMPSWSARLERYLKYGVTNRVEFIVAMTGKNQVRARVRFEKGRAERVVSCSFLSLTLCANAFAYGWKQEQSGSKFLNIK